MTIKRLSSCLIVILCTFTAVKAQHRKQHNSFDIAIHKFGVSFGNSEQFNGMRFNFSDRDIKRINGANFTIWSPGYNAEGRIRGISLGLIRPEANDIIGLTFGGAAIFGGTRLSGINISGLTTVCSGDMRGVNFGTLLLGTGDNMTGLNASGLITLSFGNIQGVSIGGFALIAQHRIRGFNVAGLAVTSPGRIDGITLSGLIMRSPHISGVSFCTFMIRADKSLRGFALSAFRIKAKEMKGISIASFQSIEKSHGITLGLYNAFSDTQYGICFGLVNFATTLKGAQIGLINYAKNNPKWARLLPFINLHL